MILSDWLADQLAGIGVQYVYGVPGGPSIPYLKSFRNAGIEFILTSNEAASGFMADVTARLTGVPGICHSTYGPGATNLLTGTGCALLDRSPVLIFTSEMPGSMISRTAQMNIDHQKLFTPVTKATFRMTPGNAAEVLATALHICMDQYPGPVHIGLPSDVADSEIKVSHLPPSAAKNNFYQNDTRKIISLLENCRRPLIAIGLTAARLKTGNEIRDFLEKCRIPVVLTPMAKGVIPCDHPCYAGVLFHALSNFLEDIYEKTDLVIGIGYDPVEYNYESWMPDIPLVHFDTRFTDMPPNLDSAQFAGTPEEWFRMLRNINAGSIIFEQAVVKGIRDQMESVINSFDSHFGPVSALKVLQEEIPPDTIVSADVGSHLHLLGQLWETSETGKLLMTNGWSSMGFGIPASIAAQINNNKSRVVCITGDGGFLMMAGEMMTARRYNLPVIVVVLSDGELNLIRLKQMWKNTDPYGTTLYEGDLFGSDFFLGVKVIKAVSGEEMRKAIRSAISLSEPVIINACVDPEDYKWLVVKR
jgi:acetolactate synthase-1/2/3 large subunit